MKFVRQFDRYISLLYVLTIISVVFTCYFTFKEVIDNYHKRHREALIPLFSMINSEIIRPLNIAHFMATDKFLVDYVDQENIEQSVLLGYLQRLTENYQMVGFVASEKHDFTIESTGKTISLQHDNAEWFHRLKALPDDHYVDIGNVNNPHLYFDIKMRNSNNEFLGFAGVALDLNHFAERFALYHQQFGFELIFTDHKGDITLTSNHLMRTDSHHRRDAIIHVSSLPWYKVFTEQNENGLDEQIVTSVSYEDKLISRMPVSDIQWQLYIIAPSASEKIQYWQLLAGRLGLLFIIILCLYASFLWTFGYYKRLIVKGSEIDFLTKLPNRSYVDWRFDELVEKYTHVVVVLADIDKFKLLNDTYGHLAGDIVLKDIAKLMHNNLRKDDVVGRWGGEEFVILLPNASHESALEIINRLRENIAQTPFYFSAKNPPLHTSVSFGISIITKDDCTLEELIASADRALYTAKANGRNRVEIDQH